jgi:hypothetical protein
MSPSTAERWVVISAVVTAGVYLYRVLGGGPTAKASNPRQLISGKPPPPLGQFATAWGVVYLVIALMAEAAPGLGGGFAILVMTGDLLANTPALAGQVKQNTPPPTAARPPVTSTQPLDPLQHTTA